MYLYKFELSTWGEVKITRTVVEVEEKPKTYMTVKERWKTRILKSDVGVLSGYDNRTLYLLEDDTKKATQIFVESLKNKIEAEKNRIQNAIESSNKRIAEYENGIEVLSKGVEGE